MKSVVHVPSNSSFFVLYRLDKNMFQPSDLMSIDPHMLPEIVRDYFSFDFDHKRDLSYNLVKAYHTQSRVRDPIKAADELAARLFYEVLSRRRSLADLFYGLWSRISRQDMISNKHQLRLQILICCIKKSNKGLQHLAQYRWLRF
jgi:hypothetical protein